MDSREPPPSPSYTATTNKSSTIINAKRRARPTEYSPAGNIALGLTPTAGSHDKTAGVLAGTGPSSWSISPFREEVV